VQLRIVTVTAPHNLRENKRPQKENVELQSPWPPSSSDGHNLEVDLYLQFYIYTSSLTTRIQFPNLLVIFVLQAAILVPRARRPLLDDDPPKKLDSSSKASFLGTLLGALWWVQSHFYHACTETGTFTAHFPEEQILAPNTSKKFRSYFYQRKGVARP
jgi:hypothetical protein